MSTSTKTQKHRRARAGWLAAALALIVSPAAPAQPVSPLSFDEALQLAVADSPRLAAQAHAAEAAEAAITPAGQLPDPKLTLAVDNLPVNGADRWSLTQDFMTMRRVGVMQDFPRAEKRRLREARARAEADKEGATLVAQSAAVRQEIATAWLDQWFAQAQVGTLAELEPEAALVVDIARAQLAGGKGSAADALAARGAAVALQDRLTEVRRDLLRTRSALARWVGPAATRPLTAPPDLTALSAPPERLLAGIEHHPALSAYGPMAAMARAEVGLARAAKQPDWSLEFAYQQRGPAFSNMVSVAVRIDLPLWGEERQDPLIRAREKQLEQVEAEREDARRMHAAELRADIATWESAKERAARLANELVPLARERTAAALAAYRGGRGDLNAVLAARSNEIETRLMAIRQQAELGQAWARLNFLLEAHTAESR